MPVQHHMARENLIDVLRHLKAAQVTGDPPSRPMTPEEKAFAWAHKQIEVLIAGIEKRVPDIDGENEELPGVWPKITTRCEHGNYRRTCRECGNRSF